MSVNIVLLLRSSSVCAVYYIYPLQHDNARNTRFRVLILDCWCANAAEQVVDTIINGIAQAVVATLSPGRTATYASEKIGKYTTAQGSAAF